MFEKYIDFYVKFYKLATYCFSIIYFFSLDRDIGQVKCFRVNEADNVPNHIVWSQKNHTVRVGGYFKRHFHTLR